MNREYPVIHRLQRYHRHDERRPSQSYQVKLAQKNGTEMPQCYQKEAGAIVKSGKGQFSRLLQHHGVELSSQKA